MNQTQNYPKVESLTKVLGTGREVVSMVEGKVDGKGQGHPDDVEADQGHEAGQGGELTVGNTSPRDHARYHLKDQGAGEEVKEQGGQGPTVDTEDTSVADREV